MKRIALLLVMPLAVEAQTTINGGRIFKGTLDASGAASTLPYRTGAGSPQGRDACSKAGETYFQTDSAAGQNVWGCTAAGAPGTWNQMTAGASVVTGTSVPGGTCTAGALYVRTDMQQFYICSATNTWQMAGYASNLLANRPLNCLAGQLFLATDAGTLWFCSTPGSPGTWQVLGGAVASVFGRTGPVTAQTGDYTAAQITNAAQTNAGNTFTAGTQNFSQAAHTLPAVTGVTGSRPATCTAGEVYFATDAPAGRNWSFCTATNTWTATTEAVPSVFGRTGAVTAQAGDYTAAQVTNAATVNAANAWTGGFLQNFSADDLLLPIHASDPATCTAGQLEFNSTSTSGKLCTANNSWTALSTGGGITQLTGDVTAGPGSGAQATTVARVNGTTVPTNSSPDQTLVTTATSAAAWVSLANCVAAGGVLQYSTATHSYTCHTLVAGDIPATLTNTTSVNGTPIPASATLMATSTALTATQEPAHTGDVTNPAGSLALTLATVNSSPGSCGDATHVCQVTTNGKGLVTNQSAVGIAAGGNASIAQIAVVFSATPTFTRTANIMEFTLTLTGNVTSSTLAGAVANDLLIFQICQDATGNRTFVWPTGFAAATTISPTAGTCTKQQFQWDGANANTIAPATSTDTPFVISGAPERAAPATPASGLATLWFDSTRHTATSIENGSTNTHIMPRTSGAGDQLGCGDLSNAASSCSSNPVNASTQGQLAYYAAGGSVVSGVGPGTAKQLVLSNGISGPQFSDFPERLFIPAANCNNATGGAGWSIGSGGSVSCRAGVNNLGGYITISDTASTFATFQITLPEDWDSTVNPYIRFQVASTDNASGHTIIPTIQIACYKGDGSTTDDVAPNAAHALSTLTTNTTNHQFWITANTQMNATDMAGCAAGSLVQITVGRATDTATNAQFYGATVTIPRLPTVQAN